MRLALFLLLIASLYFKLTFISLAPQPIIFDADEYKFYSYDIMENFWTGRTGRTYAYPMFLATIFSLFGRENFQAVFITQAVVDILSGLLLYLIARRLFRSSRTAFLVLIIQLFNPFTTAYIGVLLTEVLAAFLIVLSLFFFFLILNIQKVNRKIYLFLFLEGIALGLLTQTRPSFLYFNLLAILIIPYLLSLDKIDKLMRLHYFVNFKFTLILLAGTLVASSYQVISNLKFYNQLSLTTVDSYLGRELYDGAILKTAPLFPKTSESYPIEMRIMYAEYSTLPRNAYERRLMSQKYFNKAVEIIKSDPLDYLSVRLKKMWSMWQKPNIFFYEEPNFEKHWIYTYIVNLIILFTAFLGLIFSLRSKDIRLKKISLFTLFLVFYMTFTLSLTHAEPRLTFSAYPLLFLFSIIGIIKALLMNPRKSRNVGKTVVILPPPPRLE